MKAQSRKALQGVMKSPSPDIVNRSIITNTKSPVNQVKQYIKMRQTSTSPQSMTTSLHQITKSVFADNQEIKRLKKYIQELQNKLTNIERIQISHQQLTIINQRINAQNAQLRLQIRELQSKKERNISPSNLRPYSPKAKGMSIVSNSLTNINTELPCFPPMNPPTDNILRQFNERILKMSDQNKRLAKKLKEINEQKEFFQKQNAMLKVSRIEKPSLQFSSSDNDNLKKYFADEADKLAKYYQRINENKISQLNARIMVLQEQLARISQKQNQNTLLNRISSPHELKANISIDTRLKTQSQDQQTSSLQPNRYGMAESKYTNSPSEFKTYTLDTSPIRMLEQEKDKIRRQNDNLMRKILELQSQLKKSFLECGRLQKKIKQMQNEVQNSRPLQESNLSISKIYQEKNENLEHQLTTKITDLKFKDMKIQQLQGQLVQLRDFRQKQAQNYNRKIGQQKEKNLHFQSLIQEYDQKLNQIQQNYLERYRFDQLQTQLQLIQKQYHQMKINLQKYLEMVLEIRHSITGENVQKCLEQVEIKWTGYDELQLEIIKIHESHQMIIQKFKKNILEKDLKIANLEKQNEILKQTTEQSKLQIEKLQKAIFQYNQPARTNISEEQLKKRINFHQSSSKNRQPCKIRDYINKTVSKISDLENQIDMTLRYHQTTQKIHGNKNFSPVQPDQIYQGSNYNRKISSQVRQFPLQQVESEFEQIPQQRVSFPKR